VAQAKKIRLAAGQFSLILDPTAGTNCAVGVISPAGAVLQGDSIPEKRWMIKNWHPIVNGVHCAVITISLPANEFCVS
jgi:hypothetical protein